MRKWIFLLVALLLLLSPLIGGCGGKKYDLTIAVSPSGGGTTVPAAGTHTYDKDASVTITATPSTGYQFVNWSGDASGTTATATVTMTKDKSVKANFAKITYTLTMAKVGNGTTTPTVGASTHDTGTVVDITATADSGWHFVNWTGDVADVDDATTTVTMSANKTATANFAISTYTLTMAKVGNGTIDPAAGAHTENAGAVVNLTATADSGWQFVNWTGDATGTTTTVSVTMSANKTVTANFVQLFTLTMAKVGTGTITPAVGTHPYSSGTVVDITATPEAGWYFVSWTGVVADANSEATTVTMNADKTITGNFTQTSYTLTMDVDGEGTTTPAVADHVYGEGRVVTITATAASGWQFDSWDGDVANATSATTTVTMDEDQTVTANFVEVQGPAYPGVGSQWVYTVTYGTEVTTWTVTVGSEETVGGVDCYKSATTFSAPPQRVASDISVTVTAADTWRSEDNLAQYKAIAAINMYGTPVTTTMTDTYTAGTADFFTLSNTWTVSEYIVLDPPFAQPSTTIYDVVVVGQEDIGSFLDCYKVEYSVSGNVVKTEWWSPDVLGFVKQVSTGTYALPETQVLASYSLA